MTTTSTFTVSRGTEPRVRQQRSRILRDRLDALFAGLGTGVTAYLTRRARVGEIQRLNALSDAELAQLGITRDRIPHHVFRDLFHI